MVSYTFTFISSLISLLCSKIHKLSYSCSLQEIHLPSVILSLKYTFNWLLMYSAETNLFQATVVFCGVTVNVTTRTVSFTAPDK